MHTTTRDRSRSRCLGQNRFGRIWRTVRACVIPALVSAPPPSDPCLLSSSSSSSSNTINIIIRARDRTMCRCSTIIRAAVCFRLFVHILLFGSAESHRLVRSVKQNARSGNKPAELHNNPEPNKHTHTQASSYRFSGAIGWVSVALTGTAFMAWCVCETRENEHDKGGGRRTAESAHTHSVPCCRRRRCRR